MKRGYHGQLTRRRVLTHVTFAVGSAVPWGQPRCGGSSQEQSAPARRERPTTTTQLIPSPNLGGRQLFPPDNPWNTDISAAPVESKSDALIASIGLDTGLHPDFGTLWQGRPIGIPYTVVSRDQPRVPVTFEYDDESDPGPYPIPPDALIEGGADADGDRHVIVVDRDSWMLYELYDAHPQGGGGELTDGRRGRLRPALQRTAPDRLDLRRRGRITDPAQSGAL